MLPFIAVNMEQIQAAPGGGLAFDVERAAPTDHHFAGCGVDAEVFVRELDSKGQDGVLIVMPATPEMLYQYLAALNIETRLYEHPPLGTVEESRQLRGNIPGGHCKNLFLRTKKKESWLVVTLEDRQINLKALAQRLGVGAFSFGSPSRLLEHLGVSPGEVTPFALINDADCRVKVALDQEMLTYHPLNYHPLVNTATLSLSPDNLLVFIRSCGHEPNILSL